jgi:shikimate kinase
LSTVANAPATILNALQAPVGSAAAVRDAVREVRESEERGPTLQIRPLQQQQTQQQQTQQQQTQQQQPQQQSDVKVVRIG